MNCNLWRRRRTGELGRFRLEWRSVCSLRNALTITEIFANGEGKAVGLQVGDVFWAYEDWNYNDKSQSA